MMHRRRFFLAIIAISGLATACASAPRSSGEAEPLSSDQAWVASTCDAGSPIDSTWRRHRIGDITIAVPPGYRVSEGTPYSIVLQGRGNLWLNLHRNARYLFDEMNRARRFQNWCRASYSGYQAEVLAWRELTTFRLVARWEATWGGQDAGKWLFAQITATHLEQAYLLRSVLHTIRPVKEGSPP